MGAGGLVGAGRLVGAEGLVGARPVFMMYYPYIFDLTLVT